MELKQRPGKTVFVPGSATLVKSLLKANLLDELQLLVDPVLVGRGRRLYESEDGQVPLKLIGSSTFANGVLSLTFVPAG
jgi:dihydrofolate reductase